MRGFLIVIADSRYGRYKGIDRVPPYPPENADEAIATEEFALGNYKSDDTNLIDSLDQAIHLLRMFASARRAFELIYCSTELEGSNDGGVPTTITYGYDVASVTADYWSIVSDFSSSKWANTFRSELNEFGLFEDRSTAENYMSEYRLNDEADADSPFEVVLVKRVTFEPT